MSRSRMAALDALMKIETKNAYSNIVLNEIIKKRELSPEDAALTTALVYGTLERKLMLDYIIGEHSSIPVNRIEQTTRNILRLGALQLVYMDKIPESAAVNESVILAKRKRLFKTAGFINAVLRNIASSPKRYYLPDPPDETSVVPVKQKHRVCKRVEKMSDAASILAVKYSVPSETVRMWISAYGYANTLKMLKSLAGRPALYCRVNTIKTSEASLLSGLAIEGVGASRCDVLPGRAVILKKTGSVEKLSAYIYGKMHVQDLSSQLCVEILGPEPGNLLIDVCSAPGGKAFTAAQLMQNRGSILAFDIHKNKLNLIRTGARRLGIDIISTDVRDASADDNPPLPMADRVLCDVPCSGLGVISHKPEIRYRKDPFDDGLPKLQYKILCESAKALKCGGRLVYSTCTLNPRENSENTARFLAEHPDFYGIDIELPNGIKRIVDEKSYELTLLPQMANTDGFYIAVFGRRQTA